MKLFIINEALTNHLFIHFIQLFPFISFSGYRNKFIILFMTYFNEFIKINW